MQRGDEALQVGRRLDGPRRQDCAQLVHHPGFDLRTADIDPEYYQCVPPLQGRVATYWRANRLLNHVTAARGGAPEVLGYRPLDQVRCVLLVGAGDVFLQPIFEEVKDLHGQDRMAGFEFRLKIHHLFGKGTMLSHVRL